MSKKNYLKSKQMTRGHRVTEEEKDLIFQKLEPYLKTGLSLNLACHQARIPKSSIYDLYNEDKRFAEKVDGARAYLTVVSTSVAYQMFGEITKKLSNNKTLTREETDYVKWFLINFKGNRDIYGQTQDLRHEGKLELSDIIGSVKNIIEDKLDVSPTIQNTDD